MNTPFNRTGLLAIIVLAALACEPASTIETIDTGAFGPLEGYADITGRAQLVRTTEGTTLIQVHVEGLAADAEYPAHVHSQPCAYGKGGPHYKIDPTVDGVVMDNELWPRVTTNGDGIGRAAIESPHRARGDALSIVVHDPNNGNAKMACADLVSPSTNGWAAGGDFQPFASAENIDRTIRGEARLTVSQTGSILTVQLRGLDAATPYKSHIHALPCGVNAAGPHYKFDPSIPAMEPANEIWPTVVPDARGQVSDTVETAHIARADAQSVVVHRVLPDGSKPKVACANLTRTIFSAVTTRGSLLPFDAAAERGYDTLAADAVMTRDLFGRTTATLDATGLTPNEMYMVHVHAYSCTTNAGGGHYKFDPTINGAAEENEIWLSFRSSNTGTGRSRVRVAHLARPEAQSVIIHDYTDGARLGCIDLDTL